MKDEQSYSLKVKSQLKDRKKLSIVNGIAVSSKITAKSHTKSNNNDSGASL